jgi:hypothetical protein
MPGLLYHLDDGVTAADLRDGGLDYLAPARGSTRVQLATGLVRGKTTDGPGGKPGTIVGDAVTVPGHRCRYVPDEQRWIAAEVPGVYVGCWHEEPISPVELARPRQLAGHYVELLDGQSWLAPIARGWTEEDGELRYYVALPQRLTRHADGQWGPGAVVPPYARLWEIAELWEARWQEAVDTAEHAETHEPSKVRVELSLSDCADLAVTALAANYRVTVAEVDLLGLLDDTAPAAVLDALIDMPTRMAWLKKKLDPAGSNTAGGSADSTDPIDPR